MKTKDIRIKLNEVKSLFNTLDPAPFIDRDLDDNAVEFIVGSAREYSLSQKIKVTILLPEDQITLDSKILIKEAIRNHFSREIEESNRKLKKLFMEGRKFLIMGSVFLFVCLVLSKFSLVYLQGIFSELLSEGLIIAGWVSLWKPISIFLYDWWPIVNEKKIYEKIKVMEIHVKPIIK